MDLIDEPVPAKKQKKNPKPKKAPIRKSARTRSKGNDCQSSEPTSPMSCVLTPVPPIPEVAGHTNLRENSLPPESPAKENGHIEPSAQSLENITADILYDETVRNNKPVQDESALINPEQENGVAANETGPPNISSFRKTKVPARRSSICETAANDIVPDTSSNESTLKTNRSITPNNPVPLEDMISPSTANEIRCTIRSLFPNGPPKPPPVIPVKKNKKGDTPYIVGCTKRKRVPESKSLKFFKGDDYGITAKTNAFDDKDAPLHTPAKRSRITYNGKISKSRFNPHSDEIAARLKLNDTLDDLIRNPSENGNTPFMSDQNPTGLSEFNPLPSTSKDSKTIQKNEKHFTESLNASKDNDEMSDDEDLPAVILTTKHKKTNKKKKRKVQNENLNPVTVTTPTVLNDIVNQINSDTYLKEIDFHGIFSMKKSPSTEDFIESNRCISPIVIEDENMNVDIPQPESAMKQDDIIEIKDNTMKQNEISELKDNAMQENDTIEIKDNNTLNDFPKEEKIVDIDEILAEYEAYKKERNGDQLNSRNIINIVDPITLEATKSEIVTKTNSYQATAYRNTVDLVTPHTSTSKNNMKDLATPLPAVNLTESRTDEVLKSCPSTSSKKDNAVDLVEPQSISIKPKVKKNGKRDPSAATNVVAIVDLENCKNAPSTSSPVIEIPDVTEPAANVSLGSSTRRYWWSDDVEIVSDTLPDRQGNTSANNDVEIVEKRIKDRLELINGLNRYITAIDYSLCPAASLPQWARDSARHPISQKKNEERSEGTGERGLGDCPICLERLLKTSVASTTCGHVFCLACLKQALKTSRKRCPTCRKALKGAGYTQLYL